MSASVDWPHPMPPASPRLVAEAVRRTNVRVVISTGCGGLTADESDEQVLFAIMMPHGVLFAWGRAAVHDGGAGATGAAPPAGVPRRSLFIDEGFWG